MTIFASIFQKPLKMKKLFFATAVVTTAMLTTGSFKPDASEAGNNADRLEGYRGPTHLRETDSFFYTYQDGTSSEKEINTNN